MDSVEVSPFSLGSTTDSPSVAAALAGNQFHLESNSFKVSMDSEIKSTGVRKEDGKEVTQPALDDLSTSCLPSKPFKVIPFTYVYVTGSAKTGHICTNYTTLENGTFVGLCL